MTDKISKNLPEGKTIIDVFADFMRYLFDSAKALFKSLDSNGGRRWYSAIGLVLIHPKGWGRPQRTHLRNAAVTAGIVPDTLVGHGSVYFITKGDASINFFAIHTQAGENLKVCHTVPAQSWFFDTFTVR